MSVVVNDAALANLLRSTHGPVGLDLARRADQVLELAASNARGPIIDVDTGDLVNNLRAFIRSDARGLFAQIGSSARHRGFAYPGFVHRTDDPHARYLRDALRDGFR